MCDMTERPEGIDVDALNHVGSNEETIYKTFKLLLENEDEYNKMSRGRDRATPGSRYRARVKSSLTLFACQTQTRNVYCWNFDKGKPTNGRRPGSSIKEVVKD